MRFTETNFKRTVIDRPLFSFVFFGAPRGFYVRTKSEAIVARRIYHFGYHFQYEKELRVLDLDGLWKSLYPDFTIWLDDGRVIYLEHVGMLQDERYQKNFSERLVIYHKNNLLISRNVFITMDGPGGDIDIDSAERSERYYGKL